MSGTAQWTQDDRLVPQIAGEQYGLTVKTWSLLEGGQINRSYLLIDQGGRLYVLQRLNDFLAPEFIEEHNFALAAEALAQHNLPAPLVLKTQTGQWLARMGEKSSEEWWRLLVGLEGAPPKARSLKAAAGAAKMLGRCHRALNEPRPLTLWPQSKNELTNHYLCCSEDFSKLLKTYEGHPHLPEVSPFLAAGSELAYNNSRHDQFKMLFKLRHLIIHGDPKLDNFLSDEHGEIQALIDWDTVSYGHGLLDLADGLRSWAAIPLAESDGLIVFRTDYFLAALKAYQQHGLNFSAEELSLLPAAIRAISLNLARRYLTDSLAEVYFAWNPRLYPSLYVQNLQKGRAMLALSQYLWKNEAYLCHQIRMLNEPNPP